MTASSQPSDVRFHVSRDDATVDDDLERIHGVSSSTVIAAAVAYANGTLGGLSAVPVEDEGTLAVSATAINFVGAGVSAADGGGGVATVTIPGGGSASNVFSGVLTATDNGLVNNARHAADGAITHATASLASTGAAFTSADIGLTVNVTQAQVVKAGGSITTGTNSLTLTAHGLTAADIGKYIMVDSAGATSFLLTTTIAAIPDANTITLTANAATTASGVAVCIVTPPLHTSIASVAAGVATLAATASWDYSSADVVVGTPNRAAFASWLSAAATASKTAVLPPGAYMVELSTANPNATASLAGYLRLLGAGRNQSVIYIVHTDMVQMSGETSLVQMQATASLPSWLEMTDLSVYYYGNDSNGRGAYDSPIVAQNGANGTQRVDVRFTRVSCFNVGRAIQMNAGLGSPSRRVMTDDCHFNSRYRTVSYFTNTGENDSHWWSHNTRHEGGLRNWSTSSDNFASFQNVSIYCHPNVGIAWFNGSVQHNSGNSAYAMQYYSGSFTSEVAPYTEFHRIRFETGPSNPTHPAIELLYQQNGNVASHVKFFGGEFVNNGQAIMLQRGGGSGSRTDLTCEGVTFRCAGTILGWTAVASSPDAGTRRFVGCTFNTTAHTSGSALFNLVNANGGTSAFEGCDFQFYSSGNALGLFTWGSGTLDYSVQVVGGKAVGGASNTSALLYAITDGAKAAFYGFRIEGVWPNLINQGTLSGDSVASINFDKVRFLQSAGVITPSNINYHNNNIHFTDCEATSVTPTGGSGTATVEWIPKIGSAQPTAVASAATITPDVNHSVFTISGTTALNQVNIGGTTSTHRSQAGVRYLIPSSAGLVLKDGSTLGAGTGTGNIRTKDHADLTLVLGQVVALLCHTDGNVYVV